MRRVVTALIAMTCLAAVGPAQAQPQPQTAAVAFQNKSDFNVIIKGYTIVNGVQRAGPLVHVKKGGTGFETGVPMGIRYYSVYDANQPARVLLQEQPTPIRTPMVVFNIVAAPNNRVILVPAAGMPAP